MNKKIITFDIWDTLIKRRFHPEISKLKTIQYLYITKYDYIKKDFNDIFQILKLRNKIESDIVRKKGECLIDDVFKTLLEEIFENKKEVTSSIVKELVEKEIEIEIDGTYVNPDIYDILEKYKDNDKYCVSDFYMNKKQLSRILKAHNLLVYFKDIYVSADLNLTKRNEGKIFIKVADELNVKYSEIIHIGDNDYSDIEMPKKLGIETVKIYKKDSFNFDVNNPNYPKIDFKNKYTNDKYYNLGLELSEIAYNFIYDIILTFKKKGAEKVFYQTREGETFIKFHKIFEENNPFPFSVPTSSLLEVSRVATFGPSIEKFDIQNLLRLWSQYRSQSLKTLFKSINIDYRKFNKYIYRYKINPKKVISEPWFDHKINQLLMDKEFITEIEKELQENRNEVLKYFKKLQIKNKMFLVDIGWRGSIQDNIAKILNNVETYGFYLALFERYNIEPDNVTKYALLNDLKKNYEYVAPLITLLELMFNSPSGSVIGYKDGKSIRKIVKDESEFNKTYIKPIQRGIFDGIKYINETIKDYPLSEEILVNKTYDKLKEIKTYPSKEIVDIYFKNVHNDIFGSGKIVKKGKLSFKEKINIFKVRNILKNEIWKEGFIKVNNLKVVPLLLKVKGAMRILIKKRKKHSEDEI